MRFEGGQGEVVDTRALMAAVFDVVDVFTSTTDGDRFLALNETCREIADVDAAVTYRVECPGDLRLMAVSAVGVEDLAILVGHSESVLSDTVSRDGIAGSFEGLTAGDDRCLVSLTDDGTGVVVVLMQQGEDEIVGWRLDVVRLLVRIGALLDAQVRTLDASRALVAQLQSALVSRVTIEQAKGILAERLHVEPTEAFQTLRRSARGSGRSLQDVALEIVETVV